MKATTEFLNGIVLAYQPTKLTSEDQQRVHNFVDRRRRRDLWTPKNQILAEAAQLLAHYGWPDDVTALVVRLIADGVGGDDYLLVKAWKDRHLQRSPWATEIARVYGLGYPAGASPGARP